MPEERKLATILFADIVGSSGIGAAEDPEVVRRTLARAFAQMRETLKLHGGTVEKFVGDAVMAVFGVPQAHDDDADRAVRAAFAVRSLIAAMSPSLAFPLELRIGVNSGQVVAGVEDADTLVTGGPVNAAARLQQSAAPGEIVVGELTRHLTRESVRYGTARQIDAKGLGALSARPAVALLTAVPEQQRGLGRLRAPLIGRDSELRLLRESFQKTTEERAAYLMTIFGQAGVGKSRLVRELVEIIGRDRVLRGRCLPYGSGITYWPLQEILRADAGIGADDPLDEATRKIREAVLATFGAASEDADPVARRLTVLAGIASVADALPDLPTDGLDQELRWAVRRYFEHRAAGSALALIIDDIHWAEEPMLQMIEHLAEWSRAPVYILCLARPDLRDKRPSWGGGLMNAGAIRLESLSESETRRLIAALLAIDDLPESLRETVVSRAQGNPLYVEELLRMLIDSGNIEERGERWIATRAVTEASVPATLQALLTARLDQLPSPVKRVLQRASVVGKVFYQDAVSALGAQAGRTDELLTSAARRDFVIERDERAPGGSRTWQFRHILIRDVAYESIPKEERSRLHDAVGRWLESSTGDRRHEYAEIVAYHADQAYRLAKELRDEQSPELGRRALGLVLTASRRARRVADVRSTRVLYERASDIADAIDASMQERAEALGFGALAAETMDGARKARDRVAAALTIARAAGPSEALVELLVSEGHWHSDGDIDQGRAFLDDAVAVARQHQDPAVLVAALLGAATLPYYLGDMDRSLALAYEARKYIDASGERDLAAKCLRLIADIMLDQGDFETFVRIEKERIESARVGESKFMRELVPEHARYALAMVAADYEGAASAGRRVVEINAEFGRVGGWQSVGEALAAAGRHEEAIEQYLEAIRVQTERATAGIFGEARQKLARAQLASGDLDAAVASAELAYREIAPRDVFSRTTTATALAMVREAQGEFAEADRLHREALTVNEHTGYQLAENQARLEYARFLLRQGRAKEARPLLETVREFYAHPFVKKRRLEAEELLRRCDEVRA